MENNDFTKMEALGISNYNRPYVCKACGGLMIFKGVGEYECEECKELDYDDYGKARNYLEEHPGATSAEITDNTGVSQRSIRQMLRDGRLEVAADSKTFIQCEICNENIRFGRFCDKCESAYHRGMEQKLKTEYNYSGFGADKGKMDKGEKRFIRKDN